MRPGTKPKPTVLKLLEGQINKKRINQHEPKSDNQIPRCPIWLEPDAKEEWTRIVPELHKLKLLTKIDLTALIGYCQSWARYVEAEKYLSDNDSVMVTDKGYMQQVPQVGMSQKYLKLCQSFMIEFGLTPSARGRMSFPGEDKSDVMENLLSTKR